MKTPKTTPRLIMNLSPEQDALLTELTKKKAIPRTSVVNIAIKEYGDRELGDPPATKKP